MSMPFDATLKDMARDNAADFLVTFDRPPAGPLALLNVDLSTVTTSADLVVGLGDPLGEAVHLDFQSTAAAWKHADILVYNALLYATHRVPVHSIVLLLRPAAAHSNLNGLVRYAARSGRGSMNFSYEAIRLWERPAEELLAGPLGTSPLAVLGALPAEVPTREALAGIAQRLIERLEREASSAQARKLLTAAFLLAGLRVRREVAKEVFRGVRAMRDSDTYLAILDEGREDEVKRLLRLVGEKRLGSPEESILTRINALTDLERLERMMLRLDEVADWQELLNTV